MVKPLCKKSLNFVLTPDYTLKVKFPTLFCRNVFLIKAKERKNYSYR